MIMNFFKLIFNRLLDRNKIHSNIARAATMIWYFANTPIPNVIPLKMSARLLLSLFSQEKKVNITNVKKKMSIVSSMLTRLNQKKPGIVPSITAATNAFLGPWVRLVNSNSSQIAKTPKVTAPIRPATSDMPKTEK